MVQKPEIKNSHRDAFKEGRFHEIPDHVLEKLKALAGEAKQEKAKKPAKDAD